MDSKQVSAAASQHRMAAVPESEHEELVSVPQPSTRKYEAPQLATWDRKKHRIARGRARIDAMRAATQQSSVGVPWRGAVFVGVLSRPPDSRVQLRVATR